MKASLRTLLAVLPRTAALAAAFLGTAELFLRIDAALTWNVPLKGPWSDEALLVHDSLGLHGRPGYRFEKWRMNNEGFRGPDITVAADAGRVRIVTLGASETFGLYEREGAEYPARMQVLLDSLSPGRFQVINAALAGMSLPAMVPYYENYVARLRPQTVLLYPSPSFYLEINPLVVASSPPKGNRAGPEPAAMELRLVPKAREVLKELVPPRLVAVYREWKVRRIRAAHPPDWVWSSVPADRMALMEQHLDRLVAALQATGTRVILITHTNRFIGAPPALARRDHYHLVNLMAAYYPRASEHVLVAVDSAANDAIRRVAARHGAEVLEAEGRIPPGGQFFADYAHFTDAGADIMARLLTAGVLRQRTDPLPVASTVSR